MRTTEKELQQWLRAGKVILRDTEIVSTPKTGRVASRKIQIDGHEFASQSEADIYWEFKVDPEIEIVSLQPYFTLQQPFERNGKKYRAISYTADFRIKEKGEVVIVEVKSVGTLRANSKSYPMRRKLFLKNYPDLAFREILFEKGKRVIKDY